MIVYELYFAAISQTKKGNGKRTWRLFRAWRYFDNDELARMTPIGQTLEVGIYRFKAIDVKDSLTERGVNTTVKFELQRPARRIDGLVCFETYYPDQLKELVTVLEESKLLVSIGPPLSGTPAADA